MRQFDAQDGGLHRVQAAVVADDFVVVLLLRAVHAQHPSVLGNRVVVRHEQAAVAVGTQCLGWKERVSPNVPHRARLLPNERRSEWGIAVGALTSGAVARVARTERLSAVFDDLQVVAAGDLDELRHRARLSVEMNRHDRPRLGRDRSFELVRVDVKRVRVDVDEDGRRTQQRDALSRREERKRRRDDLVAWTDAQRAQPDHQRIGARVDGDGMFGAQIRSDFGLECRHFRPHNEVRRAHHALRGCREFVP